MDLMNTYTLAVPNYDIKIIEPNSQRQKYNHRISSTDFVF